MEKFFTTYNKIRKWLVPLLFIGVICFISVPISVKDGVSDYIFISHSFNYGDVFSNSSQSVIAIVVFRYILLISFFITGILSVIFAFLNKNFPFSIPLLILLTLTVIAYSTCSKVYAPAPDEDTIAKIFIFLSIAFIMVNLRFYCICITIISTICIVFEVLIALIKRKYITTC